MQTATRRHVNYAEGYAALGLYKDAERELGAIAAVDRLRPEVLGARVTVAWEAKSWEALILRARDLVEHVPSDPRGWIAWAFALRELGCVLEAKVILLEAEPLHGKTSAVLHYNLACYHCLLGEMADARTRLKTAFRMHPPFKEDALADRDLEAMWAVLRTGRW